MKRINFLLTAGFIISLLLYAGCGSTTVDPQDTAQEIRLALLTGTWSASANSVTRDLTADPAYDNFTVTFAGTINADKSNVESSSTFTTNDITNAFPSGTWTFDGGNTGVILRGTGIKMNISSITETALTLSFTLNADGTSNRSAGLSGSWVFSLTK